MSDNTSALKVLVKNALESIAAEKGAVASKLGEVLFERPRQENHGDWATNTAMKNCKLLGYKPRDLAQEIVSRIGEDGHIAKIEVAGPGFINFYLSNMWIDELVKEVLSKGKDYGRADSGHGRKAQVEFVSANPTGPLHVGHGRGAAVGDVVGNILAFAGWEVEKEYYVNDAGLQINILGRSTQARYFELLGHPEKFPMPQDSYSGDYVYDVAREIINVHGNEFLDMAPEESLPFFKEYASGRILGQIKDVLSQFGVRFDRFFSEKSLYERKLVPEALKTLEDGGHLYNSDDAVWFRTTDYGDDKDRVLMRSNGVPTYFTSDIAYHKDKFDRGFDLVIDVWGADHHGYVPRMKAAVKALGYDPDKFAVLLIQFVNLLRNGKQVRMSKRNDDFVTLEEVLNECGIDATRYYFLMRRSDSHLDFDLELAKAQTTENPVYYVQYAHARMCSLLRKASESGIEMPAPEEFDASQITTAEEKRLFTAIARMPEEVRRAAIDLDPHRIVSYAYDLSTEFHSWYNNSSRILEETGAKRAAHLLMIEVARTALKNMLALIGVSAPERM